MKNKFEFNENEIVNIVNEFHKSLENQEPIYKGCINKECFCTGDCYEIVGYKEKNKFIDEEI